MMKPLPLAVSALLRPFLLVMLMSAAEVWADDWEKIVGDNGRTVEVDPASIFNSDHGTKVSWGRVVLSNAETARTGYHTIKALNRYDCLNRSFVTIKRVYLDSNENVVREETLPDQTPSLVRRNSVDELIWRKMCGLTPTSSTTVTPRHEEGGRGRESAVNRVDKLAAQAEQAAQSARPVEVEHATVAKPAPASVASPPKLAPIPAPVPATVVPVPEKAAVQKPPEKAAPDAPTREAAAPVVVSGQVEPEPKTAAPGASVPVASEPKAPALTRFDPTPAAAPMQQPAKATPAPPVVAAAPVQASRRMSLPPGAGTYAPRVPAVPAVVRSESARILFNNAPRPVTRTAPEMALRPVGSNSNSWSYHGAGGPEFWGRMRPEWKLCGEGSRQSPLDFATSAPVSVDLDPVKFDYRSTRFLITNTDILLRVKVGVGMGMEVRGQRYALEGFTLHHPAETYIDGKAADMSIHFYHRDGEGRIAVLAVQAMRGDKPNALLQTLLNNLPLEQGGSYMPEVMIDVGEFLPASPAHFLYMGSITAPPCAEGVLWVVMKEPVTLSNEQYNIFVRLHESNARPVQPANARLVLESR
jgi:carbonic anhydrase